MVCARTMPKSKFVFMEDVIVIFRSQIRSAKYDVCYFRNKWRCNKCAKELEETYVNNVLSDARKDAFECGK